MENDDSFWQQVQEQEEQEWQAWLSGDPEYLKWLDSLNNPLTNGGQIMTDTNNPKEKVQ